MISLEELSSMKREIAEAMSQNLTPSHMMGIIDKYIEKPAKLYNLRQRNIECTACALNEVRKQVVLSDGEHQADLMFIGEGPGQAEDEAGKPFVGKAGQLLNKIINAAGWKRHRLYIANIVKCRPPENRDPQLEEITACLPWLHQEIDIVNPKVIVCLGSVAAKTIIKPDFKITQEHGKWFKVDGRNCTAIYHPAYILRQGENAKLKAEVWKVMQQVQQLL